MKNEVTIQDIAKALNLSRATVGRALNGSELVPKNTRSKIVQVATELGYQRTLSRSLVRSQKGQLLGAMVTQLNSTIASSVVSGAETTARQLGYGILVSQSMNKPGLRQTNLETISHYQVKGILVTSAYFQEYDFLNQLAKLGIPLVVVEESSFLTSRSKKKVRDYENAYELTTHLIEKGCKRIGYVSVDLEKDRNIDLLSGYREAMQEHKLAEGEKFELNSGEVQTSWPDICDIFSTMIPRPDGLIFSNRAITAIVFSHAGELNFSKDEFWLTCRRSNKTIQTRVLVELGKLAAALLVGFASQKADIFNME
jgi:LacI family transcriptional regulator